MNNASLVNDFEAYSQWRMELSRRIAEYRAWLGKEDLNDSQRDLRLQQLIDRLAEDKLHVAFVAEFSRGKSELINAIFLSDLKQRLLPSTAGRTTMCPTELLYDPARPARSNCCRSRHAARTPVFRNTRVIRTNGPSCRWTPHPPTMSRKRCRKSAG